MGFKYSDEDGLRRLILRYVREWNKRMPLEPSNYLIVILDDVDEAPIDLLSKSCHHEIKSALPKRLNLPYLLPVQG
jgi:hypothetical protein